MVQEKVKLTARCLNAMAHPKRLEIIAILGDKESNVQDLSKALNLSQSSTSLHLNLLQDWKILDSRREGNQVFYRMRDKKILKLIDLVQDLFCSPKKQVGRK